MAKMRKAGEELPVRSVVIKGRTYVLHVASSYERQRLRGEATAQGARQHGWIPLLSQLGRAVAEAFGGADDPLAAELIARIEAQKERVRAFSRAADADERLRAFQAMDAGDRGLLDIADVVRRGALHECRRFVAMSADDVAYSGLFGLASARWLLDRVDGGFSVAFTRRPGQTVADEVLDQIPDEDLDAIAATVQLAATPTEDEAKNFVSPSSGPSAEGSSTAASTPLPTTP